MLSIALHSYSLHHNAWLWIELEGVALCCTTQGIIYLTTDVVTWKSVQIMMRLSITRDLALHSAWGFAWSAWLSGYDRTQLCTYPL